MSIDLSSVEAATFEACRQSDFEVAIAADQRVVLTLECVRSTGKRHPGGMRDPFVLEFCGPGGLRLPEGTYRLESAATGPLELFLSQKSDGAAGSVFEAVFS